MVTIKFYAGFEYSDITDSLGNFDIKTTAIVPEGDYSILLTAKIIGQLQVSFMLQKNVPETSSSRQKHKIPPN